MKEYVERDKILDQAYYHLLFRKSVNDPYGVDAVDEDDIKAIPAADVVDGETYRELLKVAKKMHCWIFLNTDDELGAYDECGLTDEMNVLLGYDGQFTVKMDGGADDEQ